VKPAGLGMRHPQRSGSFPFAYHGHPKDRGPKPESTVLMKAENDIRDDIRERMQSHPEDAISHYWLGVILSAQGRHEEAEQEYRRVILLKKGQWFKMRQGSLMTTLPREKAHPHAWNTYFSETLGIGSSGNLYLKGAEESLRKTIQSNPKDDQAHLLLGKILFHQGQYEASEMALKEAVRLNPGNVMGHYHRGVVLLNQERFEEAEKEFRLIVQKHPHDPVALAILATIVGLQGKNSMALEIWTRALSAEDDPHQYRRIQAAMLEYGLFEEERS
jgi:Flp pilus assembly protein TadD